MPVATTPSQRRRRADSQARRALKKIARATAAPDPLSAVTLAEVAERISEPATTIAYQAIGGDTDGLRGITELRRLAYLRIIERFDTDVSATVHEQTIAAVREGRPLEVCLITFSESLARSLAADPSTSFLLAAASRWDDDPHLAEACERAWTRWSTSAERYLDIVLAAHQHQIVDGIAGGIGEIIRTVCVADWVAKNLMHETNTQSMGPGPMLCATIAHLIEAADRT